MQVTSVPGQTAPLNPVVQRADGSYVGTVSTSTGSPMAAFTGTGSSLWMGPNDTPQMVTLSGGVIGTSGTTYNENGSVDGELALQTVQSWTGSNYQLGSGSINQVSNAYNQPDPSFAPFDLANQSTTNTATQQVSVTFTLRARDKVSPDDSAIGSYQRNFATIQLGPFISTAGERDRAAMEDLRWWARFHRGRTLVTLISIKSYLTVPFFGTVPITKTFPADKTTQPRPTKIMTLNQVVLREKSITLMAPASSPLDLLAR